jgi:hypothetical protein
MSIRGAQILKNSVFAVVSENAEKRLCNKPKVLLL